MSEDAVLYKAGDNATATDAELYCIPWFCENCGFTIAMVVDGHARIGRAIDVELGPKAAIVTCPKCGAANVWAFNGA